MNKKQETLADIQKSRPSVSMPIDWVGIRGLHFPLALKDRKNGVQNTIALVDLGVNLGAQFKGTHMSRFVETLNEWNELLGYQSMYKLLETLCVRLEARQAQARFSFPYLINKTAPSGACAPVAYRCSICGALDGACLSFIVEIEVPVMTVCPCSLAISNQGAHSQRSLVRLRLAMDKFIWLEDIIALAESSASSAVFSLLKREDEKFITEKAFANPAFVEDVARQVAQKIAGCPDILNYKIEVESFESIHNHNAFAIICSQESASEKAAL